MTDYVLDTHACLFALGAPKKLGAAAEIGFQREPGRTDTGLPALRDAFTASPN